MTEDSYHMVTSHSLANSIKKLGYEFEWIRNESDFDRAEVSISPTTC